MKLLNLINLRALLFGPALLLLASCGSYQYTGYEHDGIYSPENREAVTANKKDYDESYEEALYYKQLFAQQADQYSTIPQEGAIFTDIDAYSSAGMYEDELFVQESLDYQGGNGPWGDQIDEVAINIYNNSPFYGPYMSPYYAGAGFYNPYWGRGYGYGWNNWGYGYGWNNWGYGYGAYSPWGWNHWNAGWAMHSPYYGGFYSAPYYGRGYYAPKNVAYSNSRRSSYSDYNSNAVRSNSQARSSRIQDYSNSRGVRAERSSAVVRSNRTGNDKRTYSTRTSRVESPRARSNSNSAYRSSRSSNSRSYENNTQARSTRSVRSNNTSSQVRRSTTTSRSSGTMRSSSSSSSRSSGTVRSTRGRGN